MAVLKTEVVDTTTKTEVLVVGGGPCGLVLAIELGRRGVKTLLVDAKPGVGFSPQANATQARTMEHFRRLGFADQIRSQGLPPDHPTDIAYFTRFSGHELARLQLPTAAEAAKKVRGMGGSWSAAELPHRISQKFVEATLLRQARALPSNELRYGWRLLGFEDRGDHVRATIAPVGGGDVVEVEAGYLVGADGARSFVRHSLGIAWEGSTGARRDFMGGQMFAVHLRAPQFYATFPHRKAWMYVCVNHERRAFMATIDGKSEFAFHAALQVGEDGDAWGEAEGRQMFSQAFGADLPIEVLSVGNWTAGHSLVAQSFQRGRVFLAGDAVHLFTPTGGLGYNTGVEDAVNLGWKLATAVRGSAGAQLLASYEIERKPLAHRNTAYAQRFADSVGLFQASAALEEDSAAYAPTARPGGRPPHAWLDDGRSLFDTFHSEWTLLVLGPHAPDTNGFTSAARELGMDLAVVMHPSKELRDLYEAPLALIRPDQIVAWRGEDSSDAARVLRTVIGQSI